MLRVAGLEAAYGSSQVLFGIDFEVNAGEVVTLMGRNGMGKTTTVNTIMGLVGALSGTIEFEGEDLVGEPSYVVARKGLGLVPEGRQVFPNLTVRENLIATAASGTGSQSWTLERVFDLFPGLVARATNMGSGLSGGEQQMLAIGRALMTNPKLLILDEATEGLAPLIRTEIWQCIENLKADGQAILLIDKSVDALTRIGDRHYIIEKGQVAWSGDSTALSADLDSQQRLLGV
tara:strand:+ start:683 stop:1381 length:699 start_codon:yes stop_codon:yes gene_type:complete